MNVLEELIKYQEYRVSIAVYDNLMVLTAEFPEKWAIDTEVNDVLMKQDSTIKNKYYFLASLDNGEDLSYRLLEVFKSIVQKNIEHEDKIVLFKDYIGKLNSLFEEKTLEELKTLEFKFQDKKRKYNKKKNKEENTDEQ